MPSSDTLPKGKSAKLLVVGDSGTHKTFLCGTFPKLQIFDFDGGLAILRGKVFDYDTFRDAPFQSKLYNPAEGIYPWGTAWTAFIKRINEVGEAATKGESPYETLAFDSLSTMTNICMNYVRKERNLTPTSTFEQRDWGSLGNLMESVIDQITAWPAFYKIFTAHVQRDTNDITMNVEKLPLLYGKLAGKAGIYFDEVYYADSKKAAGGQEFYLRTLTDATYRQAKSRFGVPEGTPTTFEALKPYLDAGMAKGA